MFNEDDLSAVKALEGCDYEAACLVLTQHNYVRLGRETADGAVFGHDGSDRVIRLFRNREVPEAMEALARKLPDNPFLPRIDALQSLSDSAHALVMERLIRPWELLRSPMDRGQLKTVTGPARAYRNFPLGDKMHEECHKMFGRSSRNKALGPVLDAVAETIRQSCDKMQGLCLRFNNHPGNRILLRQEGAGYRPVFADPFRLDSNAAQAMQEMQTMLDRRNTLLQAPPPKTPAPMPAMELAR